MLVVLKKKKEEKKPVKVHLLIQNGSSPKSCHVMYKSHSKLYSVPSPLPMTLADTSKRRQKPNDGWLPLQLNPPPPNHLGLSLGYSLIPESISFLCYRQSLLNGP